MIDINVTQICKGGFLFEIRGLDQTDFNTLIVDRDKIIDTVQKLITAATELLPQDCKGEIELLQAVHRKLDSKGEL